MHTIRATQAYPLFNTAATRALERAAANALPPHTLMQRAGRAVARLAQAIAPHARTVWIACGPGNNGGDGLEAAMHLRHNGRRVVVTWLGQPDRAPADARASWERAQAAGVEWADGPPDDLGAADLCIDALLGIGVSARPQAHPRAPDERLHACLHALQASHAPVLAVDVPSGLDADTGQFAAGMAPAEPLAPRQQARHTLSLLTLKPGLFTASGRDAAGQVWWDDLGAAAATANAPQAVPDAWLNGPPVATALAHASHKGTHGDVAVVGGEGLERRGLGMAGAALLAASAALHGGAGRVLVALLDGGRLGGDAQQPELMFRQFQALELEAITVVCGCGGGEAVAAVLPEVIGRAARLVLDADALNAIAVQPRMAQQLTERSRYARPTVLTPHPLEAARLLGMTTAQVQADRLAAARAIAERFQCVAVLKGSGTVIAEPGRASLINITGNGRLATAGTGDVLAGLLGARLASGMGALHAAASAAYQHGQAADVWPADEALTASALARRLGR